MASRDVAIGTLQRALAKLRAQLAGGGGGGAAVGGGGGGAAVRGAYLAGLQLRCFLSVESTLEASGP